MQPPDPPRFFQNDRAILVACMIIALVFWVITKLSNTYDTQRSCEVKYHLPEGKILANEVPEKLTVAIKGTGWDLMRNYFQNKSHQLVLQLSSNERQLYNSTLLMRKLQPNQKSIEVTGLNIDMLELEVEDERSKTVPITLDANLTFDDHFHLRHPPTLQPDSVVVSGPVSALMEIHSWPTEKLELTAISTDQELQVNLSPPAVKSIRLAPSQTALNLTVDQLTEKSIFVPITVKNAPDSITIFPENIKIICVVGMSRFDEVDPSIFVLEVDMAGIEVKTENNTLPVQLTQQPDFVKGVQLSHHSVEFFFVEKAGGDARSEDG